MTTRRATKAEMAARVERVREMAAQGASIATIADVLGVCRREVHTLARAHGIDTTHGSRKLDEMDAFIGLVASGASIARAARQSGIHPHTGYAWMRKAREAAQ